ncbi:MAG: carbohydrate ABC transporter permease [Spirochaetaceae bacterium]|nr:MAG: carbohydrate ABC transporter permease [Spirochaetaceae bacterium]
MKHVKFTTQTRTDIVFDVLNHLFLAIVILIILYPLYFVVIASFSNPDYVNAGLVTVVPRDVTLLGYQLIFADARIWTGYGNTIIYAAGLGLLGSAMTLLAAFALSRRDLPGRTGIMVFFVITMYFQGGLIPTYLVIRTLGLVNTRAVMVLFNSFVVFYVIIARTFYEHTIPEELYDAARIDGCSIAGFYFRIALPLSKAIVAVILLYYVIMEWNSFFKGLVYLREPKYYPLQLVLREILVQSEQVEADMADLSSIADRDRAADLVRYGVIFVASVPMLVLYPFLQRYFVQGVMIGAIKG